MNRELKFRVWDDLNKKWLFGYEHPNLGGFSMMGEVMCFGEYHRMLNSFSLDDWDKIKIMQFTGKKDKNGKDIYEGDMNQDRGIVKWNTDSASFVWDYNNDLHCFEEESEWCEIIGNIFENPELLK